MVFESHLARHQVAARLFRRASDKCHGMQRIDVRGRAVTNLFIQVKKTDGSAQTSAMPMRSISGELRLWRGDRAEKDCVNGRIGAPDGRHPLSIQRTVCGEIIDRGHAISPRRQNCGYSDALLHRNIQAAISGNSTGCHVRDKSRADCDVHRQRQAQTPCAQQIETISPLSRAAFPQLCNEIFKSGFNCRCCLHCAHDLLRFRVQLPFFT